MLVDTLKFPALGWLKPSGTANVLVRDKGALEGCLRLPIYGLFFRGLQSMYFQSRKFSVHLGHRFAHKKTRDCRSGGLQPDESRGHKKQFIMARAATADLGIQAKDCLFVGFCFSFS